MQLGTARYGDEKAKKNYWGLEEGSQVYRILPPMGNLAAKGRWSEYYSIHFGYKNEEGKMRVFASPEVYDGRTKTVVETDPAKDRLSAANDALTQAMASGNNTLVASLKLFTESYNLDKKHYLNVMTLDGRIGQLKIPHRSKQALDAEIKRLRTAGVDPLSLDNGRFFVFTRTGKGRDTLHTVTVYKTSQEIPGYGKVDVDFNHQITQDIIDRLGNEAFELDRLFKMPTSAEVAEIVKADIAKDYSKIDAILGINKQQAASAVPQATVTVTTTAPSKPISQPAPVETTGAVNVTPVQTQTTNVPNSAATVKNLQPAAVAATVDAKQSQEDFLRSIGAL